MALYASKGYAAPHGGSAGVGSFEEAENLSAYYNDDDAQHSDFGANGYAGRDSAYSGSSYGSSSYASSRASSASTVSTQLKIKGPGGRRGSTGFFDTIVGSIADVNSAPVEASANDQARLHDHWHNYDIHKSLKPKLLPEEDYSRAQTLLYAFRISYAKLKKREIKIAKEQEIQHFYAIKIQCAARIRAARRVRRRREAEKEREADELGKYNEFKRRLVEGIKLEYCDVKTKQVKDCVAKVNLKEPKVMVVSGPKIAKAIKFELLFLYKVRTGWTSPTIKEMPRDLRPTKERTISLEGKGCLDFGTVGNNEDAKYDREEYVMCFRRLAKEMNSSESIYRDAHGNRVRVTRSVFEPVSGVTLKSSKDNQVELSGKNIASLYKIQHRFTKHKQKILKNEKVRNTPKAKSAVDLDAAFADAEAGGRGGGGGGSSTKKKGATVEVEPRPSALSDLSLMTDEAEYAEDPSRWAKNTKGRGGGLGAAAADAALGKQQPMSELEKIEEAEAAKLAILERRKKGARALSQARGGGGRGDSDSDSDDDYSEEGDYSSGGSESTFDSDEDGGFDDQASYTEYSESRSAAGARNELLDDSDDDEGGE